MLISADNVNGKRTQNYKFMEEGHYRTANKNGQAFISRTDGKVDGNCFMELAKEQMGVKTPAEARANLKDFPLNDPFKAAKYVNLEELKVECYMNGRGLQNFHH